MKSKMDKLIDKMLQALGKAAYDSGKVLDPNAWWPLNYLMYRSLFFTEYYQDFIRDFEQVKRKYSLKRIADVYKYPTAIWLTLVNLPATMKMLEYDKRKRIEITLEFIRMMKMRMAGNVFCEDNKNAVWGNEKIGQVMKTAKWMDASEDRELVRLYGRLHANLVSFNEAVYWNANCSTREVHGPYNVMYKGRKAQLIVREFYNLHATGLVPLLKNFPYYSCTTFTLYDPEVSFDFPVLNDYTHNVSLSGHTIAVCGEVCTARSKIALGTIDEVEKVCKQFEDKGSEIANYVESMDRKRQVVESVLRVYFRSREIKKLLGKDWKPSGERLYKIEKAFESFPEPTWRKLTRTQYLNLIDPRVN